MSRSINEVQCTDCGKLIVRGQNAYSHLNNPYCRTCLCGSCAEPFSGARHFNASDAQYYCTNCVCYKCSSPIIGDYVPKNGRKCCMKCCCRICRFPLEAFEAPPNCGKCRCHKCSGFLGLTYFKGNGNRYCESCGEAMNSGSLGTSQLLCHSVPLDPYNAAAPTYYDSDDDSNDRNIQNAPSYNEVSSFNDNPTYNDRSSNDNNNIIPSYNNTQSGSSYNAPSYDTPSYNDNDHYNNNNNNNGYDQNNNFESNAQGPSSMYYNVNMNRTIPSSNTPNKDVAQHICGFCKSGIQGIHMRVDDDRYHVMCFVCSNCGVEATRMINDQPFCPNCKPDSSRCNVCKQLLRGEGIEASGKYYHENCFTCTHCHSVIDGVRFKEMFGRVILCSICANNDEILENVRPY